MMLLEPRWKSYIVATNQPVFTPEQCDHIIRVGQNEKQIAAKVGTSTLSEKDVDPTKLKNTGVDDSNLSPLSTIVIPDNLLFVIEVVISGSAVVKFS